MKYTLSNENIANYNECADFEFPRYTSQIINLANQNAQATRPRAVGQLTEIFALFINYAADISIDNWKQFYMQEHPNAFEEATVKICNQINNLRQALELIDEEMVRQWVEDLIIYKTYNGLYLQKAILASLAHKTNSEYRLATPDDEAKGIDGYVGGVAYSIKPITYKTMDQLSETILAKMIFYTKTKTGLTIEVED